MNLSDVHSYLYAGSTSKILSHYQLWWGAGSHINVGYNENQSAVIAQQIIQMLALGVYGTVIDFEGVNDSGKSFHLASANTMANYLTACFSSTCPMRMGVMEDQAAFVNLCPTGATDRTACISADIIADMDYVNANYASQSWYLKEGSNPIVLFFINEASWSGTNWTTVWANVKAHTNAYSSPFRLVFQDTGGFTHTQTDGAFAWVKPAAWSSTNQFFWGDPASSTPTYLNNFYSAAQANPTKIAIGSMNKGFDDNGGSFGSNRVIAQRCGQTLLNTSSLIGTDGYNSGSQLEYVGIPTWNDYEEGTEVETGIDNCYRPTSTRSGNIVSWSLNPADATYATTSTISKFIVWSADTNGNLTLVKDNIPAGSTSTDVTGLIPAGSNALYLQMVSKPMFLNRSAIVN